MSKIFISYRRDDTKDIVGRIFDYLVNHFEEKNIFKDIDSIPLGSDFREVIEESVQKCDVILVIIGKQWLQITDESGKRRLDSLDDFVRIEIESGLKRNIPIIPILVNDAQVPSHTDLPETLVNLSFRHGISIRPDPDFKNDINMLINSLDGIVKPPKKHIHFFSLLAIFLAVTTLSILIVYYAKPLLINQDNNSSSLVTEVKAKSTPLPSKEEQYLLSLGIDKELISKARSGIPKYEANLGWALWQKGDFTESAKWNKKAAEHGDRYGQKRTGLHYQKELGVDKDFRKAAYWHKLAATQGDHYSKFNLALMYANGGYGLSRNLIEAYKWSILADKVFPSPEGNDKLLKDLENRLSKSDKDDAKKLASEWRSKQNNKINTSTESNNKNLKLVDISNKGKIAKLEIESLKSTQYYKESDTLVFFNWGYVNSQEKIINTHSSKISFQYKVSNEKLKDNKGKIWQPKLRIILSERKLSKDNIRSRFGIEILLPSNEEHFSVKSKYEFNAESEYRGNEIIKPSIWHSVNINFNKNSFSLIINGIKIIDSKKVFSKEQYYLVVSSWNSADFQVRDLKVE